MGVALLGKGGRLVSSGAGESDEEECSLELADDESIGGDGGGEMGGVELDGRDELVVAGEVRPGLLWPEGRRAWVGWGVLGISFLRWDG